MRALKLILVCLPVFVASLAGAAAPPPAAPPADPAVTETLRKAFDLLEQRRFDQAADSFRQAEKLAGGSCGLCLLGLSKAYTGLRKPEKAADAAREALAAEPTGPASLNARIVLCQARTDGAPVEPPEVVYEDAACPREGLRIFDKRAQAPVGSEVVRPEKLFGHPPVYDDNARRSEVRGTVMVEAVIDEEGCIQKPRVCKSVHPSLDLATLDAVRRWVFRPAELNGTPVKVYYTLTVNFTR